MKSDDLPIKNDGNVRSKLLDYQMVNPSDYFKYIYHVSYIIYHISYSFISLLFSIPLYPHTQMVRAFAELGIWAIALAEHAQFASGTRRCIILARDMGKMVEKWWRYGGTFRLNPCCPCDFNMFPLFYHGKVLEKCWNNRKMVVDMFWFYLFHDGIFMYFLTVFDLPRKSLILSWLYNEDTG